MANKGVHRTMVHITNLHTRNLHGKVEYISQTGENSLVPYVKIKLDTIPFICYFFKFIRIYILIYIYGYCLLAFAGQYILASPTLHVSVLPPPPLRQRHILYGAEYRLVSVFFIYDEIIFAVTHGHSSLLFKCCSHGFGKNKTSLDKAGLIAGQLRRR